MKLEDSETQAETSSLQLPPLIMGGAAFSYQLTPDPRSLPILDIVKQAFELGLRAIDTSPYYEPSEELLGAALSHPDIAHKYQRNEFIIMTKCGRVAADHFDYSPAWIRKSVTRSLDRFNTMYLDVVFCHDVEYVGLHEAVQAVGTLFELVQAGIVKSVGISGYDIAVLLKVASEVWTKYGKGVDVVQNWAQLSLQNTRLEHGSLGALKSVGVKAVCNASPLACGLLRKDGVPVGSLGDWHPAPAGLRDAARRAAVWMEEQGDDLAGLALRFAIAKSMQNSDEDFTVATITGIGSISDLYENVRTAKRILKIPPGKGNDSPQMPNYSLTDFTILDEHTYNLDRPLYEEVRSTLGQWVDHDFSGKAKEDDAQTVG